jgi:adenylosuccinate synthase
MIACRETEYDTLVSVNTSNAGHTVFTEDGKKLISRFLPTACVHNRAAIVIGSGTNIHYPTLMKEIGEFESAGVDIMNRLFIHETAGELTEKHVQQEIDSKIDKKIGSTAHGVGASLVDRVNRTAKLFIDNHKDEFKFIEELTYQHMLNDSKTLLEGSQGYLLSISSSNYPFTTSRITNTAGYLSFANASPRLLRNVYGVFRTFPIRVSNRDKNKPLDNIFNKSTYKTKDDFVGTSGSMNGQEISWEELRNMSGSDELSVEVTTVTKLPRRIATFSYKDYIKAIIENGVTHPVMTFMNYIDVKDYDIERYENLSEKSKNFIGGIEAIGIPFYAVSTSPTTVFTK